jgi:hypothetical protein
MARRNQENETTPMKRLLFLNLALATGCAVALVQAFRRIDDLECCAACIHDLNQRLVKLEKAKARKHARKVV